MILAGRIVLLVALVAVLASPALAQDPPPDRAAANRAAMKAWSDLRDLDGEGEWRESHSTHFCLKTNASPKAAARCIEDLERAYRRCEAFFKAYPRRDGGEKWRVYVFRSGDEFWNGTQKDPEGGGVYIAKSENLRVHPDRTFATYMGTNGVLDTEDRLVLGCAWQWLHAISDPAVPFLERPLWFIHGVTRYLLDRVPRDRLAEAQDLFDPSESLWALAHFLIERRREQFDGLLERFIDGARELEPRGVVDDLRSYIRALAPERPGTFTDAGETFQSSRFSFSWRRPSSDWRWHLDPLRGKEIARLVRADGSRLSILVEGNPTDEDAARLAKERGIVAGVDEVHGLPLGLLERDRRREAVIAGRNLKWVITIRLDTADAADDDAAAARTLRSAVEGLEVLPE